LVIVIVVATAGAAGAADLPGRLLLGFDVGAVRNASDHERWGGSGVGYTYFGEVGYESTAWLVAPLAQWGYAYGRGDVPAWESGGYVSPPSELQHKTSTFFMGGVVRLPLWRMKLRPYGGVGLAWTAYERQVLADVTVLAESESSGSGWAALAGVEFFPDPSRGFSVTLGYRYGATTQKWRQPPAGAGKGAFDTEFGLTESLFTAGVRMYTL
jgi:hypothetical protein